MSVKDVIPADTDTPPGAAVVRTDGSLRGYGNDPADRRIAARRVVNRSMSDVSSNAQPTDGLRSAAQRETPDMDVVVPGRLFYNILRGRNEDLIEDLQHAVANGGRVRTLLLSSIPGPEIQSHATQLKDMLSNMNVDVRIGVSDAVDIDMPVTMSNEYLRILRKHIISESEVRIDDRAMVLETRRLFRETWRAYAQPDDVVSEINTLSALHSTVSPGDSVSNAEVFMKNRA